jgi:2-polyprenyl-3-methyl-5-hydroxy-6-metoxy-1,4-benzoquinol methylase
MNAKTSSLKRKRMFNQWEKLETIECPVCNSDDYSFLEKYGDFGFARCNSCGLHYIQPHPVLRNEHQAFDSYDWTTHYAEKFNAHISPAVYSLKTKLQKANQLSYTNMKVKNMLDVGCGIGLYLMAAKQLNIKATGLDLDKTHITFAQSKGLSAYHTKIEEFTCNRKFDFVHIKGVLHLVRNPVSLINHARRLLADKGILYVDASSQQGLFATIRRHFFASPKRFGQILPPLHNISYTKNSFLALMKENRLECLKLFTFSLGDKIYYPSQKKKAGEFVLRLVDAIGKGAFIGAYCRKSEINSSVD